MEILLLISTVPQNTDWRRLASFIIGCLKVANIVFLYYFWSRIVWGNQNNLGHIFFLLLVMTLIDTGVFLYNSLSLFTDGVTSKNRWTLLIVSFVYLPMAILIGIRREPVNLLMWKASPFLPAFLQIDPKKEGAKKVAQELGMEVSKKVTDKAIGKLKLMVSDFKSSATNLTRMLKEIPWLFDANPAQLEPNELNIGESEVLFQYCELSPLYQTLFKSGNEYYCSVHQYVQSMKAASAARSEKEWDAQKLIKSTKDPETQWKFTNLVNPTMSQWNDDIMKEAYREGTRLKFEQNPQLLYSVKNVLGHDYIYNIPNEVLGAKNKNGKNVVGVGVKDALNDLYLKGFEVPNRATSIPVIFQRKKSKNVDVGWIEKYSAVAYYFRDKKAVRVDEVERFYYVGNTILNNNPEGQSFVNAFKNSVGM